MKRIASLVAAGVCLLASTSCTGVGLPGGIFGGLLACNPGTQVQLANPAPNQGGVSSNIGQITIVANGNSNTLYSTYAQWQFTLVDNFNNQMTSGTLNLVPDPSGPHPYASDFYYQSSISPMTAGRTWNVELVQNGNSCTPASVGSFST
ncbi:MAG TPA: hypothetical protein VN934_07850 [Candidatus Tumulicola sp.]|nr:hypothetical protein [Candidatus Tumulicola sp.]